MFNNVVFDRTHKLYKFVI